MTLPWKTWTRSLLPSTTRTWTFTSSPGAKSGMSSRSDSLSMRSVAFMAASCVCRRGTPRGRSRIRQRRELFQQAFFGGRQASPGRDEVGAARERAVQRLGVAPTLDAGVVAAAHDVGHVPAAERRRPHELRLLEEPTLAEALRDGAHVVAHHPGHEARDRLDHEARGDLSAGEHDVADAQLVVDEVVADALVDALVTPAQQAEARTACQLGGEGLVEAAATRAEQEERTPRVGRLHGREDRLRSHQHAGTAT